MMEYKYPPLPYPQIPGNDYTADDMRQYASQAVAPLLAEIERLENDVKSLFFELKDATRRLDVVKE